jgi:cobalt-zinc-cadmium efflux system outer membrane protein
MRSRRLLLLASVLLVSGCRWPVRPQTDQMIRRMAEQPFDISPDRAVKVAKPQDEGDASDKEPSGESRQETNPSELPDVSLDVQATSWMQRQTDRPRSDDALANDENQLTVAPQGESGPSFAEPGGRKLDLQIPRRLPGSEAPAVDLPRDARLQNAIDNIYPELPPLPLEPQVEPGPEGKAFTLSDLQRIAVANSPTLRQAASDVQFARGNLLQAKTYQNPTVGYLVDPTNINSTAGAQGIYIDQPIRTGGKQKLGVAAAQRGLDNAQLALRRARYDLSTAVRAAYFSLVVDQETLAVLRAVTRFTDEIYRLQTGLLKGTQAAPYEPTALRAQAFTTRLAYKQAIATYIYDWKQLVATLGLEQLPLTQLTGEVDRFIPYYEYDQVKAHVLQNHTDILTARNLVPIARYNLKLAQVTPLVPDIDVRMQMSKDYTVAPFGTYKTLAVGMPLSIWNQNKGNIMAAQAALIRASEESHRVEVNLTYNLGQAYTNYQNNLLALEYYRRNILPDLVRYYRGVYARRQVEPTSFGDLVFAQQNLSSNVNAYLGVLGSTWSSVVALADFLQTDDLFQMATPRELPELPDLARLNPWPCGHAALAESCANGPPGLQAGAAEPKADEVIPVPRSEEEKDEPTMRQAPTVSLASHDRRPAAGQRQVAGRRGFLHDKRSHGRQPAPRQGLREPPRRAPVAPRGPQDGEAEALGAETTPDNAAVRQATPDANE